MQNESKNLVYAVILSLLVLVAWQVFYEGPHREEALRHAEEQRRILESREKFKEAVRKPVAGKEKKAEPLLLSREDAISDVTERVSIRSGKLHGSFLLKGARFDDLTLADYHVELDKSSPEVVLLSPGVTEHPYFAEFGWITQDKSIEVPGPDTLWKASADTLVPGAPVTLTWTNARGVRFIQTIALDKDYLFTVTQKIENASGQALSVLPYGLINRAREPQDYTYILHEGPLGVLDEVLHELPYDDLREDGKQNFDQVKGWLGITDKYWLTALIPSNDMRFDARFNYFGKAGKDRFQADFLGEEIALAPGDDVEITQHLFAGAKKIRLLDKYNDQLSLTLFDRAVDFGWLYFLTKPMFYALVYFNGFLGSFGLAILLLTVVVKILLFPLANKSYRSLQQMKIYQPQIMEMRKKYKNDRAKMNQELMNLYKEKGVNPMAGCFPILMQIPVFFALYKVLFITIEMRHAPFYGWIHDLSAPDPTTVFNLFGLIDWMPPGWLPVVGVWPILFAATMYIQQMLNPPPADPTQAMVMRVLPAMFLFIFASFPAGLVVYWTWNNFLSIIQQWIIIRRYNAGLEKAE